MHMGLCRKSPCGGSSLKAVLASLGWVSPVVFGAQVLLEFGCFLETVLERLQQKNPKFAQKLGEKRKENLARQGSDSSGSLCAALACAGGCKATSKCCFHQFMLDLLSDKSDLLLVFGFGTMLNKEESWVVNSLIYVSVCRLLCGLVHMWRSEDNL